jgi:MFS family permease
MLVVGALGMFSPLYALFVENRIIGANELTIGLSISIYLVARSVLQIPIAVLIDRIKGELDDYYFLIIFSVMVGIVHLGFLGVTEIWQLFTIQLLLGVFTAITYPSYMAIFTRHVDKSMEGTEWGVYYTVNDLGGAALAAIGGFIASIYGFNNLIIVVSIIAIIGALLLIPIRPYIKES